MRRARVFWAVEARDHGNTDWLQYVPDLYPTRREARANAREFREFGEARVRPYRRVEPKRRRKA